MAHSAQNCGVYPASPFSPGISLQLPGEGELFGCESLNCSRPDLALAMGRLRNDNWIRSWIFTQLSTQARISDICALPSGSSSPRGWWADSIRRDKFSSGSLLWTVSFAQGVGQAVIFSKLYTEMALKPLLSWGIASEIKVKTRYSQANSIIIEVSVSGPPLLNTNTVTISGSLLPDMNWLWGLQ